MNHVYLGRSVSRYIVTAVMFLYFPDTVIVRTQHTSSIIIQTSMDKITWRIPRHCIDGASPITHRSIIQNLKQNEEACVF